MMNDGFVKFFNRERGFGYIQMEETASILRVLPSSLKAAGLKKLIEGQKVRFSTHIDPASGKNVVDTIEIV